MGLAQDPHELGDGGLQGHVVSLQKPELFLDGLANFVDGHIAAFVGNLGGHDDEFARVHPALNGTVEAVIFIGRNAAHAEGFNDDRVVMFEQVIQDVAVHGRDQL